MKSGLKYIHLFGVALALIIASGAAYAEPEHAPAQAMHAAEQGISDSGIEGGASAEVEEHSEHAGEEHQAGLPQLNPQWFPSQIFWMAVVFLSLYVIFARRILPGISNTLENRRERVEENLDTAQKLREEAEKIQQAYEEILENARQKSTKLFEEAEHAIKQKTADKINEFRAHAAEEIRKTEKKIEDSKRAAMEDMNMVAAEIASLAAEKIVGISTDIDQVKSMVQNINKKAA